MPGFGGSLYTSSDNGASWTDLVDGLTNVNVKALIVNNVDDVFAGTGGGGVFRLMEGETTWTEMNTGLTNLDVRSFVIAPDGYLYGGTTGGGVFRVLVEDTVGVGVGVRNIARQDFASLGQNFPNPCSDMTEIPFELNRPANVELRIHDALGRLVDKENFGHLSAGQHSFQYDVSGLEAGMYFYSLGVEGRQITRKMVVR